MLFVFYLSGWERTDLCYYPHFLKYREFLNCIIIFSRAKLILKKKRYQEQLLEKTDRQLETLEKMTQDLEFAQIEIKVRLILCTVYL